MSVTETDRPGVRVGCASGGPIPHPRSTALDALIDRIESGEPIVLSIFEHEQLTCSYPMLKGTTSYARGCRCPRCREAKHRYTHQGE